MQSLHVQQTGWLQITAARQHYVIYATLNPSLKILKYVQHCRWQIRGQHTFLGCLTTLIQQNNWATDRLFVVVFIDTRILQIQTIIFKRLFPEDFVALSSQFDWSSNIDPNTWLSFNPKRQSVYYAIPYRHGTIHWAKNHTKGKFNQKSIMK